VIPEEDEEEKVAAVNKINFILTLIVS